MTSSDAAKEAEMIVRQISWLHVYCLELKVLEQPGMPMERHQEIMALRRAAPHFFWLASSLLKDALIVGLDNLLDGDKNGKQLTLERVVKGLADPVTREKCREQLTTIRDSDCGRDVAKARNTFIAHPNREILLRHDDLAALRAYLRPKDLSGTEVFPSLTISSLEDMLSQVTALVGFALGKLPLEFFFPDWKGTSQLFDRLRERVE